MKFECVRCGEDTCDTDCTLCRLCQWDDEADEWYASREDDGTKE